MSVQGRAKACHIKPHEPPVEACLEALIEGHATRSVQASVRLVTTAMNQLARERPPSGAHSNARYNDRTDPPAGPGIWYITCGRLDAGLEA